MKKVSECENFVCADTGACMDNKNCKVEDKPMRYAIIPSKDGKLAIRLLEGPFQNCEFSVDDMIADPYDEALVSFVITVTKVDGIQTCTAIELESNKEFQDVVSELLKFIMTNAIKDYIASKENQ